MVYGIVIISRNSNIIWDLSVSGILLLQLCSCIGGNNLFDLYIRFIYQYLVRVGHGQNTNYAYISTYFYIFLFILKVPVQWSTESKYSKLKKL